MDERVGWRVHAALVTVQVGFGGFPVAGKVVLAHVPPLGLAAFRVLVAAPVLLLLARRVEGPQRVRPLLPRLALLGLVGVAANQILFIVGLRLTTATHAAILMPTIPVFAAAVGALLGVERVGAARALGIGLAVGGALVMLDPTRLAGAGDVWRGDVLILANCVSYAIYLVLLRPVLRQVPPLTATAWVFVLGGVLVVAAGAPDLAQVRPGDLPQEAWWGLAYIALWPTVLNYALNTWSVGRSSPSLAATYITLQPVVAALVGAWLLGERPGVEEAAGFALIVAGLVAVSRRRLPAPGGCSA